MALPSLATAERVPDRPESRLGRAAELVVAWGPAAIILTLPLEFTAKLMVQPAVRWVAVVVALALAYLVVTGRRALVWPRTASAAWLMAFVALSTLSWLVARPPGSLKELADVTLYPVFGLMVMNLVDGRGDHRRAWIAFLVSGAGVAALGFALYVTNHAIWTPNPVVANRLNITFADPNITARFLSLCAAAAVILFANRTAPAWLCAAAGAACAIVEPMTYSRSGLALIVVSVVVAAAVAIDRRRAFAFAAALVVVFALSTEVNPVTRERAVEAEATVVTMLGGTATVPAQGTSSQPGDTFAFSDNRKYLVAAGLAMVRDHPVLGVGFGGFQHAIATTYRSFIPTDLPNPDFASHTAFITVAAEEGIVGLLLLLAFLLQLAREAWPARRSTWVAVPATLIVPIVLYAQFEGRLVEEPYLWLCLGLLYAALVQRGTRTLSHTM